MTEGAFMRYTSKDDVKKKAQYLIDKMLDWDFSNPLCVKLEVYKNPRSLSQNAMSHIWYREIAKAMAKKGHVVDYDDPAEAWKLWLKKRFLGVSTISIGKHTLEEIKRTSDLNTGEMTHYLDQVYYWANDVGIRLTIAKESEYAEMRAKQES
nr:hypothetical protein [uncultured Mediterranean phage uvMED]